MLNSGIEGDVAQVYVKADGDKVVLSDGPLEAEQKPIKMKVALHMIICALPHHAHNGYQEFWNPAFQIEINTPGYFVKHSVHFHL